MAHPRGFDGEQFINHLLDRIENNALRANKAFRKSQDLRAEIARLNGILDVSQEANRRHYRDMKTVEAKIAEWADHAAQLRAIIEGVTPKKNRPALPAVPGPLETEIPF